MAFWVVGGGAAPDVPQHTYLDSYTHAPALGGKRRVEDYPDTIHDDLYGLPKRARFEGWEDVAGQTSPTASGSFRVRDLAFLVIRQANNHTPEDNDPYAHSCQLPTAWSLPAMSSPGPRPLPKTLSVSSASPMERTESGLSISSSDSGVYTDILDDLPGPDAYAAGCSPFLTDYEAARLVRARVQSGRPDSQSARILRSLIAPRTRHPPRLDDAALRSLFRAANELFFARRLSQRVVWDWSAAAEQPPTAAAASAAGLDARAGAEAAQRYEAHVVGTTALRRCEGLGGWETLIVLSAPILRDKRYSRRLLIATFLHEMIHSFLFVMCGPRAARQGGHTEGFRIIAETIDEWVGREHLRLADVEADLERFREEEEQENAAQLAVNCYGPCCGYPRYAPASWQQPTVVATTRMQSEQAWGCEDRGGEYHDSWPVS